MTGEVLKDRLRYMLAGKSTFTLKNMETGKRLTFRVVDFQKTEMVTEATKRRLLWFVKVLTGSDNDSDYQFIGSIQVKEGGKLYYKHSPKSKIGKDALAPKVIAWFIYKEQEGAVPEFFKMFHEGRCARCGRTLTVPESVESGYGPECITKI